jgi:hypothetical protein
MIFKIIALIMLMQYETEILRNKVVVIVPAPAIKESERYN